MAPRKRKDKYEPEYYDRIRALFKKQNSGPHAKDPATPSSSSKSVDSVQSKRMSPRKYKDKHKPTYNEMLKGGNSGKHAKKLAIPIRPPRPLSEKPGFDDYINAQAIVHFWEMENNKNINRLCDSGTKHSTSSSSESESGTSTKSKLESMVVELEERTRTIANEMVSEAYSNTGVLRKLDSDLEKLFHRTKTIGEMLILRINHNAELERRFEAECKAREDDRVAMEAKMERIVELEKRLEAESKAREDDRAAMEGKIEQMVLQKMTEVVQGMRPPPLP